MWNARGIWNTVCGWDWRNDLWIYLLVPLALLGLFSNENDWSSPRRLLLGYLSLLITTVSIGAAHTLFFYATRRTHRWLGRRWWSVPYFAVGVLVGTRVGIEITARIHQLIYGGDVLGRIRDDLTPTAYVVSALVVLTMVAVTTQQERRREIERQEQAARQEALRAQLSALQARTDPHFLFNSLNTVASLIDEDPARAEIAVERLSSIFRYTLEGARKERVTVAEEIGMVRAYLETEALRFEDRLQPEVVIEPSTEACLLPPLTLQPLVENAVVHGVDQLREGGRVKVTVARSDGRLRLRVTDNGPGEDRRQTNGAGSGLRNLDERLRLAYGDAATLTYGPGPSGFEVEVELPAVEETG